MIVYVGGPTYVQRTTSMMKIGVTVIKNRQESVQKYLTIPRCMIQTQTHTITPVYEYVHTHIIVDVDTHVVDCEKSVVMCCAADLDATVLQQRQPRCCCDECMRPVCYAQQ